MRDLLEQQLEGLQAVGAYAVLGCDPSASDKELQTRYREAARRLHPDRGGDKVAFQQLQASAALCMDCALSGLRARVPPWPAHTQGGRVERFGDPAAAATWRALRRHCCY